MFDLSDILITGDAHTLHEIERIPLNDKMSRVEIDSDHLLLVHKKKAQITHIQNSQTHTFNLDVDEQIASREVKDIHLSKGVLSVLLDRKEVQVYNLETKQKLFSATYRDAIGPLAKVYYIHPKQVFGEVEDVKDEDLNRFMDDEVVNDDEEPQQLRKRLPLFENAT